MYDNDTAPTVNMPLLRKAIDWVEEQAALPGGGAWNQGDWVANITETLKRTSDPEDYRRFLRDKNVNPACGTAYCVAGYVGQLLDERFKTSAAVLLNPTDANATHVSDFAAEALGLTLHEEFRLFDGANTLDEVEDAARAIAERAGETL